MAKKIFILGVSLIICLVVFVGCGNVDLKKGIYKTEDGFASVTLLEDKKFIFNRNILTSYRPEGSYSINKDKLTLHTTDGEKYFFNIKNGQLVYVSGSGAGDSMETGTVFILTESDKNE